MKNKKERESCSVMKHDRIFFKKSLAYFYELFDSYEYLNNFEEKRKKKGINYCHY